ncbi:leukocyte elastase inhibitor-like isoform X2 [Argiope bruennichi]|nr:leukocyte elastase inhibitor-like isoform X2 [Argiope bruennichi]
MAVLRNNIWKVIFVMTVLSVSNASTASTETATTETDGESLRNLGVINNKLAFDLMHQLTAGNKSENIFISPLSISMALGLLYYGAGGNTAKEMEKVLGYQDAGMTKKSIHRAFQSFLTHGLKESANFTLNAANAVLVDNKLELVSSFKEKAQKAYFANVTSVDFSSNAPEIKNDINNWVNKQTNGKIPQLLDNLDSETVFMILNAVYFKGHWKLPFRPDMTKEREFLNNGEKSEAKLVPMMHTYNRAGLASLSGCEILELPYIQDNIVMLIMLPEHGLKSFEEKLTHTYIDEILRRMSYDSYTYIIPKFKIDFYRNLIPQLKRLGLKTTFDDGDFSGMIANVTIPTSEFLHKAVIEVNEEGTKAAAAISLRLKKSEMTYFVADRPFFFVILDRRTKFILFMGRVTQM